MSADTEGVLERAIAWSVRLQSGQASADERRAWARWRHADPAHEAAWQQVESAQQLALGERPAAEGRLLSRTLQHAEASRASGRRRALRGLGVGAAGALLGAAVLRLAPPRVDAQHATAVGERRRVVLADGSELMLNTDSAVTVAFSWLERHLSLARGELFLRTGPDANAAFGPRPLVVDTPIARLEALGTRFGVRLGADDLQLVVREGRVRVRPAPRTDGASGADTAAIVGAGETWRVSLHEGAQPRRGESGLAPDGWTEGALVARRMRLEALVAELARYRRLPLRCAAEVAELRVSGVFQLGGTDPVRRALDTLVHTLPIRVQAGDDGEWLVAAVRRR